MAQMIAGWLAGIIQGVVAAVTSALAGFMVSAGSTSLDLAHQPWVGAALALTSSLTGGILGLMIAYQALTDWVLWNEGTSAAQPGFFKSALRVCVYGGLGSTLAYATFRWGFEFASALMALPVGKAFTVAGAFTTVALPAFTLLVFNIGLLLLVVAVGIVAFQMFVRGAELALFVIAAPLVALGWLSPGGGAWMGWWQKLLALSMATAVQWLCLKGMIASVATTMLTSPTGAFTSLFLMLAWAYVAYKGPHLVEGWLAYRTGMGQGMGQHARTIVSSLGR